MKSNMGMVLDRKTENSVETASRALEEILRLLKLQDNEIVTGVAVKSSFYVLPAKMRQERKELEKMADSFSKEFETLPEQELSALEMKFYSGIKELDVLIPLIKKKLRNEQVLFNFLAFDRELDKCYSFFKASQQKMAGQLYPDRSHEILSDPEIYQQLVDAWSGITNDEE